MADDWNLWWIRSAPQQPKFDADAKILIIKEEGDSSPYNQAYDKHVAAKEQYTSHATLTHFASEHEK